MEEASNAFGPVRGPGISLDRDASIERCERLYSTWQHHVQSGHRLRALIARWHSWWAKRIHEEDFGSLDD